MKRFIKTILTTAIMATMAMSALTFNAFATVNVTDPNGDGHVDIADAVYIQSYLRGQFEVSDISAMDFSGDYIVSQIDVLAVQYYVAGMDY